MTVAGIQPGTAQARGARVVLACLLSAIYAGGIAAPGLSQAPSGDHRPIGAHRPFVPHQLIVRYEVSPRATRAAAARDRIGADVASSLPGSRMELVELEDTPVRDAARELERQPAVRYAEPNYFDRTQSVPDDPLFTEQWALVNTGQPTEIGFPGLPDADIDAGEAWSITTGDPQVTVAVIDTGIDAGHPDLTDNIWTNPGESGGGRESNGTDDDRNGYVDDYRGWDFTGPAKDIATVQPDNDPVDDLGHGTSVAGVIGARGDNGVGISGVNWSVQLMPLRANIGGRIPKWATIEAISYADRMGADVINASWAGRQRSRAQLEAIRAAADTVFVTGPGNTGQSVEKKRVYPCTSRIPTIVCVAASDQRDRLAAFSSYGRRSVDLTAPGENILTTRSAIAPSTFLEPVIYNEFTRPNPLDADLGNDWTTGGIPDHWGVRRDPSFNEKILDAIADSPRGRYENNADTLLTAPPVDLRGLSDCALSYSARLRLEPGHDVFRVEASTDGGPWEPVDDPQLDRILRDGGHGGFKFLYPSLEAFEGEKDLRLRFRLMTDEHGRRDGVAIQFAEVVCATHPGYDYAIGTSISTPQVAGVAALLKARYPAMAPREIRARILQNVDPLPGLRRKVATGGRLNAFRALAG